MEHTLVAVFENESNAQDALNDLVSAGFSRSNMHINAANQDDLSGTPDTRVDAASLEQESMGQRIKDFFHDLFSGEDSDRADMYSEAVSRGGCVLTLTAADEDQVERASDILDRHDPINMNEREAEWKSTDRTSFTGTAADSTNATAGTVGSGAPMAAEPGLANSGTALRMGAEQVGTQTGPDVAGEKVLPVIEEELQVGKRTVERGGVRVVQRVTEKPVQESVQLHDERVTVERRPVDPATGAAAVDADGMQERTIEVRETVEEPVVAKTARVVEEVVIGKEQRDRTETVQDTVRRTDVEVEQMGAQAAGSSRTGAMADDADFRTHWQSSYAQTGGRYEDYAPAYQYGSTLGADERYRGQRWDAIEPQVRADWEAQHAGNPWEKTKDAVRVGWEKMTR
jgi:uncharacterized protein (TIGR02271 family)